MRSRLDVNVWIALFDGAHQFADRVHRVTQRQDRNRVDFSRVQGHNQITNLYLLALAVKRGGCLVTFDQAIALSSVRGATAKHLRIL